MRYQHTQVAYLALALGALLGVVFVVAGRPATVAGVVGLVSVVAWTVLGTLSTTIDEGWLRVRFGPIGLVRRRIALGSIVSARAVRNSPLHGWGVRYIPKGTLWNVWGLDAVELELTNGKRFRIGTDEPQALVQALRRAGISA